MSNHLTPLEVCEALIGPLPEIEVITGNRPKAAYAWRRDAQSRQAGDMPPRVNRKLLAYARRNNKPLTADHLIFGARRDAIDDLVQKMKRDGADLVAAE